MLGAGGTCEFSAQTLRSDRRGAQVTPASARASDPAAPLSGIASDLMANREDTQVANLCYDRPRGAARAREPGSAASEARMAKRSRRAASGGPEPAASVRRRARAAPSLVNASRSSATPPQSSARARASRAETESLVGGWAARSGANASTSIVGRQPSTRSAIRTAVPVDWWSPARK